MKRNNILSVLFVNILLVVSELKIVKKDYILQERTSSFRSKCMRYQYIY